MEQLGVSPLSVVMVVISHDHWDHTGGVAGLSHRNNDMTVFLPASFNASYGTNRIIPVRDSRSICDDVYSTGELDGIEQSLVVKTEDGYFVVAGCSHPGVGPILAAASRFRC